MIVIVIVLFFLIRREPEIEIGSEKNPEDYIDKCARDHVKKAIEILSPQGSYISPINYKLHEEDKIGYLCFNENNYQGCINQEPMLIEHIEQEITQYITPKIEDCFQELKQELENRNYQIKYGLMDIETELNSKKVIVTIDRDMEMTKNQETRKFDKFTSRVNHPIYDLASIALQITNQEAKYCNFEYLGYMAFYPSYKIEKFRTSDSIKIYEIIERSSQESFKFAIRGCVVPPGF